MGREIRMVPPNWDHPIVERRNGRDDYQPMYKDTFEDAAREWKEEFAKWLTGWRPDYFSEREDGPPYEYWEWAGGLRSAKTTDRGKTRKRRGIRFGKQ